MRARQIAVVVLAVWQVAAAALSQTGVLPGDDVGTISDRYDSAVDPAGYAFSIWGLIYLACLVLAVTQARPSRRDDPVLDGLRSPLAVAFGLSGVWIVLFQQERFLLAQAVIFGLTASLAVAYARLARTGLPGSQPDRWTVFTPVGLYLGWATVATVAGASTTLLALGVDDLVVPATVWGVALVLAALGVLGAVTLAGPSEPGFPLAGAWALAAIAVAQADRRPPVAVAAAVAAALVLVAVVLRRRESRRRGAARSG
jgi:hypothetical protein